MKKRKTIVIFFVSVLLLCIINFKKQHILKKAELVFLNIEALALGETPDYYHCLGTGCLDCPNTSIKVAFIREIN